MQSSSTNGFFLSALLHGSVAAIVLFGAYACQEKRKEPDHIIELVQGPGDNYSATEAAALGIEGGIKVKIPDSPPPSPTPPAPEPTPEPPAPAPEPVQEAPKPAPLPPAEKEKPKAAPTKETPIVPDMAKQLKRKIIRAESKVKQQAKKEREAEAKRISKEEFDRMNKSRAAASARGGTGKATRIDTEGIRNGVIGGSTSNKKGGANGTALSRDQANARDEYVSLLIGKIQMELNDRPGVGSGLVVEVEWHLLADGSITRVRIVKSSGSAEFDQVVKETLQRMNLPPRPPGIDEYWRVPIRGIDAN